MSLKVGDKVTLYGDKSYLKISLSRRVLIGSIGTITDGPWKEPDGDEFGVDFGEGVTWYVLASDLRLPYDPDLSRWFEETEGAML